MQSIKNIGIMAHVDAGKTTLTEQLLFQAGAISEVGRVDHGSTVTDSLSLEKARGITIRTSAVSLDYCGSKINLLDTPGHMDFITEVERTFAVLEGAILVISAREGVQSQTKAIFQQLQRFHIPTLIVINKIDRAGADTPMVVQQIKSLLTENLLLMQNQQGEHLVERTLDEEELQLAILEQAPDLQERFLADQPISKDQYRQGLEQAVTACRLVPLFYTAALKGVGISTLLEGINCWLPAYEKKEAQRFCGFAYKVDRDEKRTRKSYVKVLSGSLGLRDTVPLLLGESGGTVELDSVKITNLQMLRHGKLIEVERVTCGDIAIVPHLSVIQPGHILGASEAVSCPRPINHPAFLNAAVILRKPDQRSQLLQALSELNEEDPALKMSIAPQGEVTIQVLGHTQLEVIGSLLTERYGVPVSFGELETIYKERPCQVAEATIHINVAPNPYWASIGLKIEPAPLGSGVCFESQVSSGYLNASFQNAVRDGVLAACASGLYGWALTDLKITFFYGCYFSPVSTPADFRRLAPHVLEMALRQSGTQLLEPWCRYTLDIPAEFTAKALHDLQKMGAVVENLAASSRLLKVTGQVSEQNAREYPLAVVSYTKGQGIFLTEFSSYAPRTGPVIYAKHSARVTDEKVRNQFLKLESNIDRNDKNS